MKNLYHQLKSDQNNARLIEQSHTYVINGEEYCRLSATALLNYCMFLEKGQKPVKWLIAEQQLENDSAKNIEMTKGLEIAMKNGDRIHHILEKGQYDETAPENVKKFIDKSVKHDHDINNDEMCLKEVIIWTENLVGSIDLITFKNDRIIIADYKTSNFIKDKKEKYFLQLKIYAYMISKKYKVPINKIDLQIIWLPRKFSSNFEVFTTIMSPTDTYKIIEMYKKVQKNADKLREIEFLYLKNNAFPYIITDWIN